MTCGCGKHSFKPGDRVKYADDLALTHGLHATGTITRRATTCTAWYVRWDNTGFIGVAGASDLLHEGDDDE